MYLPFRNGTAAALACKPPSRPGSISELPIWKSSRRVAPCLGLLLGGRVLDMIPQSTRTSYRRDSPLGAPGSTSQILPRRWPTRGGKQQPHALDTAHNREPFSEPEEDLRLWREQAKEALCCE